MNAKFKQSHSLRQRIVWLFCLFTLLVSALFSLLSFVFVYIVEDIFFERTLRQEMQYVQNYHAEFGTWPAPRQAYIQIIEDHSALPPAIAKALREEPQRKEFFGDDARHYHLLKSPSAPTITLLAEVGEYLVVRPMRQQITIALGLISTLVFAFAVILGYWIANRAMLPLSKLAKLVSTSRPDALPKDFASHYPANEIGVLAHSLQATLTRIDAFIQREQNFTRDASHELRSPLAVATGAVELLNQQALEGMPRQQLARAEYATIQMQQILDTLLALAREVTPDTHHSQVQLLPIIENCILQHAYLLQGREVDVSVDVAPNTVVNAHQGVMNILLANLISNAFRYVQRGQIWIAYTDNQLSVKDTGQGMPVDLGPSVLEHRVKGPDSVGLGIGLSLVKRLCDHYGYALCFDSTPSGTEIKIAL